MAKSTVEILEGVVQRIRQGWTRGTEKTGNAYCLEGALAESAHGCIGFSYADQDTRESVQLIRDAINSQFPIRGAGYYSHPTQRLSFWNDQVAYNQAMVVRVVERALEMAIEKAKAAAEVARITITH